MTVRDFARWTVLGLKFEIRISKSETNFNDQITQNSNLAFPKKLPLGLSLEISDLDFEVVSDFGFGASDFEQKNVWNRAR